jgi:hypothetical protein
MAYVRSLNKRLPLKGKQAGLGSETISESTPIIRFTVVLGEDKLEKFVDKATRKTDEDPGDLLPLLQGDTWDETKKWIKAFASQAQFAVRADVLLVTIPLLHGDLGDPNAVYDYVDALHGFKPFQVTKFTRARDFYYFPTGIQGAGWGPGQALGSIKKFLSAQRAKLAYLRNYWRS